MDYQLHYEALKGNPKMKIKEAKASIWVMVKAGE